MGEPWCCSCRRSVEANSRFQWYAPKCQHLPPPPRSTCWVEALIKGRSCESRRTATASVNDIWCLRISVAPAGSSNGADVEESRADRCVKASDTSGEDGDGGEKVGMNENHLGTVGLQDDEGGWAGATRGTCVWTEQYSPPRCGGRA